MSGATWTITCSICKQQTTGSGTKAERCRVCPPPRDEIFPLSEQALGMAPRGYVSDALRNPNNPYLDPNMEYWIKYAQEQMNGNQPNGQPWPSQGNAPQQQPQQQPNPLAGMFSPDQMAQFQALLNQTPGVTPAAYTQPAPQLPPGPNFKNMPQPPPNWQPQRAQPAPQAALQPQAPIVLQIPPDVLEYLSRMTKANERIADSLEALVNGMNQRAIEKKVPALKQGLAHFLPKPNGVPALKAAE